jgi:hypothetical protein
MVSSVSGRLHDLPRPQTARADAQAPYATTNARTNELKIRFEPACAHIVGVAHLSPHHWTLTAHLATFGHSWSLLMNAIGRGPASAGRAARSVA